MSNRSAKHNRELNRVREFAKEAVLYFRQKHFQRTKNEFSEPSSTKQPKEYMAVQQIISKISIDRISKMDTKVRMFYFQKYARKTVLGRNNAKELEIILTDYQWEFDIASEFLWINYYNSEYDKILDKANSYLADRS